MAQYPVKRGSRYDRLCLNLVLDWTIEGMSELDGVEDENLLSHTPDYAVLMMAGNSTVEMYARMVVYSGTNGDGKRVKLKTTDGAEFTIPEKDAIKTELANGFTNWMKMDEVKQEEIDLRIIELNKPPAARHILPVEQLTEAEKTDPNSLSEDAEIKKD